MEKKFTALRIFGTIYKIIGILVAVGTVLAVIGLVIAMAAGGNMMRQMGLDSPIWLLMMIAGVVFGGAISALSIYAVGEGLYLLINLEENTRFSAMILRDRFYPPQPQPMAPMRPPMMPQQMVQAPPPMVPPQQQPPMGQPPVV